MQQRLKKTAPGNSQKNLPGEKAEMLKSGPAAKKGVTESLKTHASRWMEKLMREKWIKPKKQTSPKMHDKPVPGKSSKGSSMVPGTSSKTITTGKRSMTKTKVEATTSSTATSSKGKENALQKKAKRKVLRTSESLAVRFPGLQKVSSSDVSATSVGEKPAVVTGNELIMEEELDVDQQSLTSPERLLEDKEGNRYEDPQLRIRCYLEACVFVDDVARAQNYLLCHHRQLSKRTHLSISTYNIIMRMWAKKVCMLICISLSTPY